MDTFAFLNSLGGAELILIFFGLLPLLLSVIALIQCVTAEFHDSNNKIVWLLVILLVPILGAILWWAIGTKQRKLG